MSPMYLRAASALGLLCGALTLNAEAGPTFVGSGGTLQAQATFDVVGGNLQITLSNTATFDVVNTSGLLTGVFFDISGPLVNLDQTTGSVVLAAGSAVLYGSQPAGGVAGGEFGYQRTSGGLAPPFGVTQVYGVGNSGFSVGSFELFGAGNLFPGPDLDPPTSPNGSNYGLTSLGDDPATGNSGLTDDPVIQYSVVITLAGAGSNFDLSRISNVRFQYGTSLDEPWLPGAPRDSLELAPAPPALVLALTGLACFGGLGLRRRLRGSAAQA